MDVRYLNTDLEIESKSDLSKIVDEFGDDVIVLHHGERRGYQHASFEIAATVEGADETINSFCAWLKICPRECERFGMVVVRGFLTSATIVVCLHSTSGQKLELRQFNESLRLELVWSSRFILYRKSHRLTAEQSIQCERDYTSF